MNLIPLSLFRLDRLNIPVPPADIFEELFGYRGEKRFVAFWCDQDLYYHDGCFSTSGNYGPWAIWFRSLDLEIQKNYCFFSIEGEQPEHLLVLDRVARNLYSGKRELARQVLRQQIPVCSQETEEAELVLSSEDLQKIGIEIFEKHFAASVEDLVEQQKRLLDGAEKLEAWLDR
jgi:hypothetical protein